MDRRAFLGVLVSGLLAAANSVEAQQTHRQYVIGYLGQGSKSEELAPAKDLPTLLENLRVLGYVEGQNLTVNARFAEGRPENLSGLAAQLVATNPRVIVVRSVGIARAVLEHTSAIPVVALQAGELEAEPNVASLANFSVKWSPVCGGWRFCAGSRGETRDFFCTATPTTRQRPSWVSEHDMFSSRSPPNSTGCSRRWRESGIRRCWSGETRTSTCTGNRFST